MKDSESVQKTTVIGLGYIGLPTAVLLARSGSRVLGVDVNEERVRQVRNGQVPFSEPFLAQTLQNAVKAKTLRASLTPEPADVFLIAVPTPATKEHRPDLKFVRQACKSIVPCLQPGNLVILESTVPPGTMENVVCPILEKSGLKRSSDFLAAHCPERVMPGQAIHELINNSRVVGGIDRPSAEAGREFYERFVRGPIFLTDANTAEAVKLMENSFRDVNIALANEFSRICEAIGVDAWQAISLANRHPRVNILQPGPGVGGHCIPVDPYFLIDVAKDQAQLLAMARKVNNDRPKYIARFVRRALPKVSKPVVSVFGVTYRADIDDVRETPAEPIISALQKNGIEVRCHDPLAKEFNPKLVDAETALRGSDCLLILTDHSEFQLLTPLECAEWMRSPLVIDTRHCIEVSAFRRHGFEVLIPGAVPVE
jgi:UDP-N-acetyl-D-mannosaminuronic acid dehydrogenase